jgi:hypothetical protein
MVEMACKGSGRAVALEAWCQGGQIAGHKVDVPGEILKGGRRVFLA